MSGEIAAELVAMAARDQEMRRDAMRGGGGRDATIDHDNTVRLKTIVEEIGWPTVSRVGASAEHAAWLLVQHCPDLSFQQRCLELMRAAPADEVCPDHVAYLEDRVNVRQGRPQRFGTQLVRRDDGGYEASTLADPEHVDTLRASIGLAPLGEYVRSARRHLTDRRAGAAAVITDDRGRVLLVRHTYGELNWEIPGGLGEPGESADATAVREVREETGLDVAAERLTGIYFEAAADMHHFVFRCRATAGTEPRPSSDEISEVRWCERAALPRPISDFTVRRIDDALDGAPAAIHAVGPRTWLR